MLSWVLDVFLLIPPQACVQFGCREKYCFDHVNGIYCIYLPFVLTLRKKKEKISGILIRRNRRENYLLLLASYSVLCLHVSHSL